MRLSENNRDLNIDVKQKSWMWYTSIWIYTKLFVRRVEWAPLCPLNSSFATVPSSPSLVVFSYISHLLAFVFFILVFFHCLFFYRFRNGEPVCSDKSTRPQCAGRSEHPNAQTRLAKADTSGLLQILGGGSACLQWQKLRTTRAQADTSRLPPYCYSFFFGLMVLFFSFLVFASAILEYSCCWDGTW